MEYGEAVTAEAFERALTLARRRLSERPRPIEAVAGEAVAQAYCVCVTDGKHPGEGRLSGAHLALIDDVAEQIRRETGGEGSWL